MTVKDLDQKLEMMRIFWSMGASTRLEVRLSSLVSRGPSRSGVEDWTDLDVLAVDYSMLAGLVLAVADCKTSRGRVAERVFWLRGVADLFGAQQAFLVRDASLPPSARELADKLGIAAMDRSDRVALEALTDAIHAPGAGDLFSVDRRARWSALMSSIPGSLERLQRYRETSYWMSEPERNLSYLPGVLEPVADRLGGRDRWAHALVCDFAWLYLLALIRAVDRIGRLGVGNVPDGATRLVVGDEHDQREKHFVAEQLRRVFAQLPARSRDIPSISPFPGYFAELVDLLIRVSRRRRHAIEALRVLEFTAIETVSGRGASWTEAYPAGSPLGPKLASDVIRFIVVASKLDEQFLTGFDAWVSGSRRDRTSTVSAEVPGEQVSEHIETRTTTDSSESAQMPLIEGELSDERLPTEEPDPGTGGTI